MEVNKIAIITAVLSTGMMAGIFFTWSNAVKPGIGKLDDMIYLSALQSMNRVILNPLFYIVFILPILFLPISTALNFGAKEVFHVKLLFAATIVYWSGAFLVTLFGNIPLNELLNNTHLERLSMEELSKLRVRIENKWNTFNVIRTISSCIAFILVILSILQKNN